MHLSDSYQVPVKIFLTHFHDQSISCDPCIIDQNIEVSIVVYDHSIIFPQASKSETSHCTALPFHLFYDFFTVCSAASGELL